MKSHTRNSTSSGPIKLGAVAIGATTLILVWLAWQTVVVSHRIQEVKDRHLYIEELRGKIVHLDEVHEEASALPVSDEYHRLKRVSSAGMEELEELLRNAVMQAVDGEVRRAMTAVIVALLALSLLLVFWIMVLRFVKHWRDGLCLSHESLLRQSAELTGLNAKLNSRVAEKAHDLVLSTAELTEQTEVLRQTAVQLRESEQRFRGAFDSSAVGIALVATDGKFLATNHAFCEIVGYSESELLGTKFQAITHPDDLASDAEWLRRLLAGEQPYYQFEKRYLHKGGCVIQVQLSVFLVRDAGGQPLQMVTMIQDVTLRKQAESALRANEEQLKSLMESIPNIVWVNRPDGSNVYVNRRFAEYTGLNRQSSYGSGWNEAFHPDDRESALATWTSALESGVPYENESRIRGADGQYRWFVNRGMPLHDSSGLITNWIGTCTDIESQKRIAAELQIAKATAEAANQAKQQQVEELEILYRTAPVGLSLMDSDSRVLRINERLAVINGRPVQEIIGHTMSEIVPQFATQIQVVIDRVFETGESVSNLEIHGPSPADPTVIGDWLVSYYPVKSLNGRTRFVGCVVLEITGLKRVELDLREAKLAAEYANQAKSEFLANMSHEIRTPMNGIIGLTGLALDTALDTEQRQYLDGVMLSAESLLKLINSILDFSKIEAGKMELERIPFDLRKAIGNAVKSFALRAHEKKLELVYEISSDVPDALIGDPARLCQVVINLVGNALKFTPEGEIAVLVETEEIQEDTVSLRFTVKDTGIGIPADKQHELFQPFSQADSSTTRKFGGTGLGLVISARLVKMMTGHIALESKVGEGSRFHFIARFGRQKSPIAIAAPPFPIDVKDLRVLVVDDNDTNRRILSDQLTQWGMLPTAVEGGRAALDHLRAAVDRRHPFALILLDALMPDMDGFAVLEQIRSMPAIDRPTILMLSSVDQRGNIARARELGAAAYLLKPIRPPELHDAIVVALSLATHQTAAPPELPLPKLVSTSGRCLHILLVEDNTLNQLLATRTLEKAGHSVVVSNNGEEALDALGRETFDLVLMDLQMPVMDGFKTTARFRQQELKTGRHIPIVAMTAHALKGDRERCLEAGMDGYVSKPIHNQELFSEIAAVVQGNFNASPIPLEEIAVNKYRQSSNHSGSNHSAQEPSMKPDIEPADRMTSASDDTLEGDPELRRELAAMFLEDCPKLLSEIRLAVTQQNGPALKLAAHTLKGSADVFEVQRAFDAILRMEHIGTKCDWGHAVEAWESVDREMARLSASLAGQLTSVCPSIRHSIADSSTTQTLNMKAK